VMVSELNEVSVEVRALLGTASVTLQRLLELSVGDVLPLSSSENDPIVLCVQGRPKLTGRPKVAGGNLAVVIEQGPGPIPSLRPPPAEPTAKDAP
jgi:flagellar motor switch protein FliM